MARARIEVPCNKWPPSGRNSSPSDLFASTSTTARAATGRPDLQFHDLRHTGALIYAQVGATTKELMVRLGQGSPTWPTATALPPSVEIQGSLAAVIRGAGGASPVPGLPTRPAHSARSA